MWIPFEAVTNGVLAFATLIYGAATTALVISSHKDRDQRDKHFQREQESRKLQSLYEAYCEAFGCWNGLWQRSDQSPVTATEAARTTEALIRLQAQLRLNDHIRLADDLQRAIFNRTGVDDELSTIGMALGLLHQSLPLVPKE
jgi:hypothetical protein